MGRKLKRVLTVGVFDYFHYGHLRLFKRCRNYGDYLIVAVQDDSFILKYKPQAKILYSNEQRMEIIKELRCVDEVITYTDVDRIVRDTEFDVFVVGEDQIHIGFQNAIEWCKNNKKEVIRLSRTKGVSSSSIKKEL